VIEKVALNPSTIHPPPNNAYSHAIRSGKLLFIAGQCAIDKNGQVVGAGDIRKQTQQVFENVQNILHAADATFDNIVYSTGFLVDFKKNYPGYAAVRLQFLTKDPKPASAIVEVAGLFMPELLFEFQGIAVLE
jgi:enamine deaminase RidA (YjgF/YER057c/UK114 family)